MHNENLDDLIRVTLLLSNSYAMAIDERERKNTDHAANEFINCIPPARREACRTLYELTKHDELAYDAYEHYKRHKQACEFARTGRIEP